MLESVGGDYPEWLTFLTYDTMLDSRLKQAGWEHPILNQADFDALEHNAPPVPWTAVDVGWGVGLALVWVVVFLLLTSGLNYWGYPIDGTIALVIGTVGILLPVWGLTILKYETTWANLGLRAFSYAAVGVGCGLMLFSFGFNIVYGYVLAQFGLQIQPDIDQVFNQTRFPYLLIFSGAVIVPIIEEIFFRGFVFAGLRNWVGWRWAVVISAGIFALAHVVPTSYLPIFILGVIFAALYQISGSIWPAILMHMLTNALALSVAYAISQGWDPGTL